MNIFRPIFNFNENEGFVNNFKAQVFDLTNFDEANNKLDKIKKQIVQIQKSKELSTNTDKQNAFADYASGIDNKAIRDTAQDFDILNGSVDDFANNALANLYAGEIKVTTGFTGVNSVIKTFNSSQIQGTESEKAYAQAVGQTNANLGKYLTNLNGAKASMHGYAGNLALTATKTIGLKVATMALNTALNAGIAFLVSTGIQKVHDLINAEEIAAEKAAEQAKKIEEEAQKYKESTKSLQENISTFKELRNNTELTSEGKEQLIAIQEKLIETYGVEAEGLDLVNGKYDETLAKLKEIAKSKGEAWYYNAKSSRRTAEKATKDNQSNEIAWLQDNKTNMNGDYYKINDIGFSGDEVANIEKTLSLLSKEKGFKVTSSTLGGVRENTYELIAEDSQQKVEDLKHLLDTLERKSDFELKATNGYQSVYNRLTELLSHYESEVNSFNTAISEEADAAISKFQSSNGTSFIDVTKETYKAWRDELITNVAKDDPQLKQAIDDKLNEIFDSSITEYEINVTTNINTNEATDKLKTFVDETLSDVLSKIDKYNSAIHSISEGESISRDTMLELIEVDSSLAGAFASTSDGYTIDVAKIKSSKEDLIATNQKLIETEILLDKKALESVKSQLKANKELVSKANENLQNAFSHGNKEEIDRYVKEVMNATAEVNKNQAEAEELEKTIEQWTIYSSAFEKDVSESGKSIEKNTSLVNDYLKLQQNNIDKITNRLEDEKETQESILDNLKAQKDELEKQKQTLEEIVADYETAGNVVDSFLENKITSLTEEQEKIQKSYDDEISNIENKYDKEISALQTKNEEINKSIELKKAEDALYNAQNTEIRYYSGNGWRRGTNASEITEKQQNVNSIKRDIEISNLEKERDTAVKGINNRKDNDSRLKTIEDEIQKYTEYKESFAEMVQSYSKNQDDLTASRVLGENWHEKVLNRDTSLINTYGRNYNNYQKQLNVDITNEIANKEKAIEEQEKVIQTKQLEIDSWENYSQQLADYVEEISGTNDDYLENLRQAGLTEQEILSGRVDNIAEFKRKASELMQLPTNTSEKEIDNIVNKNSGNKSANNSNTVSMGGYSGATNKTQKTAAKNYRLYYVKTDSKGNNSEVTLATGSLSSMRENKENQIKKYTLGRSSSSDADLEKTFGYKSNGNVPTSAIKQFLDQKLRIVPYAKGGVNSVTGLAWLDGTRQKSETIFNADSSKKLFNLVSGSKDLSKLVADNVNSNLNEMFRINRLNKSMPSNTIHNEFIFTGNIQANNYAEFEKYMNTYLTKVQQDIFTGR